MAIPFQKMHGAGNDFILILNDAGYLTGDEQGLIENLCRRRFGIGADGLMLLEALTDEGFDLKFFNSDGRPASMCGNGARTAVYLAHQMRPAIRQFRFRVWGTVYRGQVTGDKQIRIYWPETPRLKNLPAAVSGEWEEFGRILWIDTNVPHLIVETRVPLTTLDVARWGSFFRHHSLFQPQGTNVNFVCLRSGQIDIRTFERGVEGETLACGTGALAAAFAATHWGSSVLPVTINARGGRLQVGATADGQYWLEGPVQPVYSGSFEPEHF